MARQCSGIERRRPKVAAAPLRCSGYNPCMARPVATLPLNYETPLGPGDVRVEKSEGGVSIFVAPATAWELWAALRPALVMVIPLSVVVIILVVGAVRTGPSSHGVAEWLIFGVLVWLWARWARQAWAVYRVRRGTTVISVGPEELVFPWVGRKFQLLRVPRTEVVDVSVCASRTFFAGVVGMVQIHWTKGGAWWCLHGARPVTLAEVAIQLRRALGLAGEQADVIEPVPALPMSTLEHADAGKATAVCESVKP
jgi:hypothetical protein